MRIDVNEKLYKIPKNNPFLNQPIYKKIWAYGLRNPWKFSFSMIDNTMFIADVGQNSWEELMYKTLNYQVKFWLDFKDR